MKILVLNGPNLNLLGRREPDIYGTATYDDLTAAVRRHAEKLGVEVEIRQSNHEGDLVDWIGEAIGTADGIVLNPAAYTHTSVALLDAVLAAGIPTVEVHLSDLTKREAFRQISFVRAACIATVMGHGIAGYTEAMDLLVKR
ncbi:MAG: type II 3-dehydroquinate dehydratase [Clostridia bacterium]|nr:type II 3-dehydroquinate dehydratase [Clostridia bacterium]